MGTSRGRPPKSRDIRFWAKVKKQVDGCWLFDSNHGACDYGMLSVSSGEYLAHRISWEIHFGPIPEGFLGTLQDNMDDMVAKGRSLKGESQPMAKLTSEDIKTIRRKYKPRKYSQQRLADEYGVNQTLISAIVRRKTWKHID